MEVNEIYDFCNFQVNGGLKVIRVLSNCAYGQCIIIINTLNF